MNPACPSNSFRDRSLACSPRPRHHRSVTDARTREAERRWRTSGSLEDGAAFLRERVRRESLSLLHVQAAAFLGDRAAAAVSPSCWPEPKVREIDAARLQRVLELGLDERLLREWACRCAEHVLPLYEKRVAGDFRPRRAIEAGRARLTPFSNALLLDQAAGDALSAAESAGGDLAARSAAQAAASSAHPRLRDFLPIFAAHDAQVSATGNRTARLIEARWQVMALIELLLATTPPLSLRGAS